MDDPVTAAGGGLTTGQGSLRNRGFDVREAVADEPNGGGGFRPRRGRKMQPISGREYEEEEGVQQEGTESKRKSDRGSTHPAGMGRQGCHPIRALDECSDCAAAEICPPNAGFRRIPQNPVGRNPAAHTGTKPVGASAATPLHLER
jgi:hypothetical protein